MAFNFQRFSNYKNNLSKKFLEFVEFFNTDECVQTDTKESGFGKGFGLLHSGGRMEIINDRIAMLDESIPAEYWEKQELLTLPNYENYINLKAYI